MREPISIVSMASISALGSNTNEVWLNYVKEHSFFSTKRFATFSAIVSELSREDKLKIQELRNSNTKYKNLDNSVLYAIFSARQAVKKTHWKLTDNVGINIGSSRGATALFEKYYQFFLKNNISKPLSSPTTTLGNISSWVAQDLQTSGPEISHSITCSTSLHSLLNGIAWLHSGMADTFIVGGSEAPLTDFTIAQMQALKVYLKYDQSKMYQNEKYPCRALDIDKKENTMVLGEGVSVMCLERGVVQNAIAIIEGVGYATENVKHNTSISAEAICFQKSMKMALRNISANKVDAVVMHAPGTIKGDLSEYKAIQKVFGDTPPFLTTNKWILGHTFGASGMLSVEFAILMLKNQHVIQVPFKLKQELPKQLKRILVNSVGFGGNAVSILITKR